MPIGLNGRLSIGARLSLIVAVFALPLGALAYVFIAQCYKDISFAEKEIAGARYIDAVWPTFVAASGHGSLDPVAIDVAESQNVMFSSGAAYAKYQTSEDSETRLATGKGLFVAVADGSNLTLDPDLDSFYAMDAATVRLPAIVAAASGARDAVAAPWAGMDSALRMAVALERLQTATDQANDSLAASMRDNPQGDTRRSLETLVELLNEDERAVFSERARWLAGLAVGDDSQRFTRLIERTDAVWRATHTELLRLLHARVARQIVWMESGLAFAGLCSLTALALAIGMSVGLSRRLSALLGVMNRLIENDTSVDIPYLQDRNETGLIAKTLVAFKSSLEALSALANRDSLTQLASRSAFHTALDAALASRGANQRLALLYVDLDRFKSVNDTLGHLVGDALLRQVAGRARELAEEDDVVARLGGDEFAILRILPEGVETTSRFADALVEHLSTPFSIDGRQVNISASIGVVFAPADGTHSERLLRNADLALYRAKSEGRDRVRYYEPDMGVKVLQRQKLESELRRAVENGDFMLLYQPLLDARTQEVVAFEALVRWRHPDLGIISPVDFIGLAEETGLINPLGDWVLRQACNDAASWPASVRVAVNLSPVQFINAGLPARIVTALATSGLAPNRLEVEITENVFLGGDQVTLPTLKALRDLGVRIALDDFGSGYSSLGYLRSFRFDKIKIDRSFVSDLGSTADSDAIVKAVVALGQSLGIATTAEGVETCEQFIHVRDQGCTEVQGYYFGRPAPLAEALEYLRRPRAMAG